MRTFMMVTLMASLAAVSAFPPSEANAVIANFRSLSPMDNQAILDFLRSL